MSPLTTLRLCIQSFDISKRFSSLEELRRQFRDQIRGAVDRGANVVLLPEFSVYAAAQLSGSQDPFKIGSFFWNEVVPEIADLSRAKGVLIVPGSAPYGAGKKPENSAAFVVEGQVFRQPKLTLTHWEHEYKPGDQLHVVRWKGLTWVTLICFDVEQPEISSYLKKHVKPNVVLVPSATSDTYGSERVHRCAGARAVELGAACAISPLVGVDLKNPLVDRNEGAAALYLPSQRAVESAPVQQVSPYWTSGTHEFWVDIHPEVLLKLKTPDKEDTRPYLEHCSVDTLKITRSGDRE